MNQDILKKSYLTLLEDSLKKKCELLDSLYDASKTQEEMFNEENLDNEHFDQIIEEKDRLIDELMKLDEGFEQIYLHIKEELTLHPVIYQNEISRLKNLITTVTEKSVQLQVLEKRNKVKIEEYFIAKRKSIRDFKVSNKTATSYYINMADQHRQQQTYFIDKKN